MERYKAEYWRQEEELEACEQRISDVEEESSARLRQLERAAQELEATEARAQAAHSREAEHEAAERHARAELAATNDEGWRLMERLDVCGSTSCL